MICLGLIPKPRSAHAACSDILQTRVYIHGGADQSGDVFSDLIVYTPSKNRFEKIETTGDIPPPLYGHSLVPHNHHLYLFGGTSGYEYFNDLYRLDLLTKVWTKVQPSGRSPEHRYKHWVVCNFPLDPSTMPTLNNNDPDAFYVIGGMNNKTVFGNIYKYHISRNQWETLKIKSNQGLFKGRYGHTWCYFNESIYIFGGFSEKKRRNDLLRFDFNRSSWRKEEIRAEDFMPSERDFHASVLFDNYFYIIGGSDKMCKLNEIHRIKIKDEFPSRTIHKDLRKLLEHIEDDHLFSDLSINIVDDTDKSKGVLYTYYPLVKWRAPLLVADAIWSEENGIDVYTAHIKIPNDCNKAALIHIFEYIYTDWIDFKEFNLTHAFELLKLCIRFRITRLFKIIARYIGIGLNFANAWDYLNQITNIEQDFEIGDTNSKDSEWAKLSGAFNTLKKVILKFITTYHKKFKEMIQYKELNPYSVLSIDGYIAMK